MQDLDRGIFGPDPKRPWYPHLPEYKHNRGTVVSDRVKNILEKQMQRLREEFGISEESESNTESQI